jgi:NitT/TauT family transport system substrate-binding protein
MNGNDRELVAGGRFRRCRNGLQDQISREISYGSEIIDEGGYPMITVNKLIGGMCLAALTAVLWLGTAATPATAETEVSIRFSWKLKGEYAPLYVAMDQGYFAEEGLKVSLGPGSGSQAALAAVQQGQETATFAPAVFGLQAISKGLGVKIIALYHPGTPMAFISHPDKPINSPKDMEGMKLAHSVGDTASDFLPVFCQANKIDCSKINLVGMNFKAIMPSFLAKEVDATAAYRTNDIPVLEAKGVKLVVLDLPQNGLNVPGGSLITSDKQIAENPKALSGMLKAIDRGYRFTKNDPAAAAKIMKKYWDTTLADEVVTEQVRQTVAAVPDYGGKPVGWIDQDAFGTSLQQIKDAGKIEKILPLDSYYTNDLNGG